MDMITSASCTTATPSTLGCRLWRSVQFALSGLALVTTTSWAFTGEHYELTLRPDFDSHLLHGNARIRLKADSDSAQTVELPSPALSITRARLDGQDLAVEKTATGWHIALTVTQAKARTLWLELDYSAPAGGGLVFGEQYVYTAFHTCQWMPCTGPELSRASIAITLELPEGYRSVASGRRLVDANAGKQRWPETQPFPLYTFGFSAGLFTEILDSASGQRLRYLGANEDEAALRAKFKDSARMLAFFEEKAGLPPPHPVYTQVLLPGDVAQEASSFSLIGKLMLDPILEEPQEDWVIAHEMAHQWWGNLITCAAWNEFWLNEGITVFMTAAWKQQRWGEAAYQREMDLARKRWQLAKDAGFDKPLSWPGDYPSLRIMRSIHYSKGALFMDALRNEIGERSFWEGFRRYSIANAGHSVIAKDLEIAMEASTGRSLKTLFKAWVY